MKNKEVALQRLHKQIVGIHLTSEICSWAQQPCSLRKQKTVKLTANTDVLREPQEHHQVTQQPSAPNHKP